MKKKRADSQASLCLYRVIGICSFGNKRKDAMGLPPIQGPRRTRLRAAPPWAMPGPPRCARATPRPWSLYGVIERICDAWTNLAPEIVMPARTMATDRDDQRL
nr:hypothetical protein [Pandoravirus aubagnensis]